MLQVFSAETTPETIISDAIRISMSIPIVFLPHNNFVKRSGGQGREAASDDLWVDGGLTNNYPVRLFDTTGIYNEHTLGFYFVSPEEKEFFEKKLKSHDMVCGGRREIKTGLDYARALLESVVDAQQRSTHVDSRDPERTVYINHLNISTLNFSLSVEEKQSLVNSGWEAVSTKFGLVEECRISIQDEVDAFVSPIEQEKMKEKCSIA
jgi:predicted acylesterase/phospholipase RssA